MKLHAMLSLAAVAGAATLALAACTTMVDEPPPSPESTPPVAEAPGPRLPTTGLDAPWSVVFVGERALVSERDTGRILELDLEGTTRELARLDDVEVGGEGGLLGLAIPSTQDALYVYSTGRDGNRVHRFDLSGDPRSLSLGPATTVIDRLPRASNHNGGRIAFGPDGMLYVTVGDAGQPGLAQDRDSLAGKILRLAPDGTVPDDNPFHGSPVWSLGHRNPQGIAWDDRGIMYASEFGQNTWDELNVIAAGDNYGWPVVEGIAGDDRFTDPIQQWAPGDASPSGIAIADGNLYLANLRGARLRSVPLDDLTRSSEHLVGELGRLRDVVVTPEGQLWILTNNTDGRGSPGQGDDRFMDSGILSSPA